MRQAYISPGIDGATVIKQARERKEPTRIHNHPRSEFGSCDEHGCYTIEGQPGAHAD